MKKRICLSLTLIILLFACRKETPVDLPFGLVEVDASCANGVMDGTEDGIDCGASTCTPCLLSYPIMCPDLIDNQIVANGIITNFATGEVTSSTATGELVIKAVKGTTTFTVTFGSASPEVFREYEVEDFNPDEEEVYVQYTYGANTYTATNGEVHLNRENGKYTIAFCNISLTFPSISAKGLLLSSN